ncbi:Polynucleotide 5'-hydroxyl-kinase grc3 [Ceratocystis pirilliformis]|uniref:Polynucleotide 5'-hydroxyl-kinase GRC3 n=1 Tax=Ceratocystis pirilliformis TaxID=259994 RepID=A0ABR3YLE5_9PEZI
MSTPSKKRKVAASGQQATTSAFCALAARRHQSTASPAISAAAMLRSRREQQSQAQTEVNDLPRSPGKKAGRTTAQPDNGPGIATKIKEKKPARRGRRSDGTTDDMSVSKSLKAANDKEEISANVHEHISVLGRSPARQSGPLLQMSSLVQTPKNWSIKSGVVSLNLENDERLVIVGSYGIKIHRGEVTIAGATLQSSDMTYWICAPLCHAVPVLRCYKGARIDLYPDPVFRNMRQLESLSHLFREIWPSNMSQSFRVLFTPEDVPKRTTVQLLTSPPEWNKKLAEIASSDIAKNPIYFICGPKGAGKSTFTRLLGNKLISTQLHGFYTSSRKTTIRGVNIVDIDPGQAEYTPPGLLSLIHTKNLNTAPPFGHPWTDAAMATEMVHSHAFGALTPGADPDLYLSLAIDLCSRAKGAPTLINTPGWTLGTGLNLLMSLISRVHPTEIIYMSEGGPAETIEGLRSVSRKNFYTLPSQSSDPAPRTSAQLRAMQTMSYFHWRPSSTDNMRPIWVPEPLSEVTPLVAKYRGQKRGIMGILSYGAQTPPFLLAESLNGMMVAVVRIQDPKAFAAFQTARTLVDVGEMEVDEPGLVPTDAKYDEVVISSSPEGLPIIANPDNVSLDSQYSCTIGLALVRGIDTTSAALQLLTPIPLDTIRNLRENGQRLVLLHGQFDAPTWAYTEDIYRRSLALNRVSVEGEKMQDSVNVEYGSDNESEASAITVTSDDEKGRAADSATGEAIPWVQVIHGDQRRPQGSRAWRVRRDLGRGNGGD